MCTDTIPVLAYVKIELFFADICYYQRINPKPITDMAKKIAEQLIDTLAESGVERIYAVTGDSLNEVNEAVRKNNKIKWIHVRHEETGAYAAAAEAQLTGRPGCCAGSSGPGHVHLINGLYDAQRSGAPVIAIASTIPSREFGTEYFQETNTIKLFNDCSYYNEVATTPKQFPRMLQSAIQTAITRRSSRSRLTGRSGKGIGRFCRFVSPELFHPAGSLSFGRGPYTVGRFIEQS